MAPLSDGCGCGRDRGQAACFFFFVLAFMRSFKILPQLYYSYAFLFNLERQPIPLSGEPVNDFSCERFLEVLLLLVKSDSHCGDIDALPPFRGRTLKIAYNSAERNRCSHRSVNGDHGEALP